MKTSVEWLISQIVEDQIIKAKSVREWEIIFQKAKEMEKEQIIDAFIEGTDDSYNQREYGKQYYNETFKDE